MKCGACCIIRDKAIMSPQQDRKLRAEIYERVGILYLYPFNRYTISLSHEEKEFFEKESIIRGINIKIIPKKIKFFDGKPVVIDWSLDHDVCPFFDVDKKNCTVYDSRPSVCKSFPNEHKFDFVKDSGNIQKLPFSDSLKIAKNCVLKI